MGSLDGFDKRDHPVGRVMGSRPPYVPDWVDLRTAEWAAALCDAMAARLVRDSLGLEPRHARVGAEVCASSIRALARVAAEERPVPRARSLVP